MKSSILGKESNSFSFYRTELEAWWHLINKIYKLCSSPGATNKYTVNIVYIMGIEKDGQKELIEQDLTRAENGVLGQCLY